MKFIVDAQLPPRIATWLNERNHNAIHTDDLRLGNKTPDVAIAELASTENRIVITKDTDFMKMHMIKNIPKFILFITTGNLRNAQLITLFEDNIEKIIGLFKDAKCIVELNNESIIVRQ